MRGGIVHRNAGVLGDAHHDEGNQGEAERHAQAGIAGETMKAAMVESCVEPTSSAREKTIMIIAGSASDAIIISRLAADAAEAGADIHARQRQEEARAAQQCDDGDQVRGPIEQQSGGEGRDQSGGDPGGGEDQVRRGAEQPGRVVREHGFLAQKAQQVAIGLDHRGAAPARQPRLHLAHDAGHQRRQYHDQQHLHELHEQLQRQRHRVITRSKMTRAAKTRLR